MVAGSLDTGDIDSPLLVGHLGLVRRTNWTAIDRAGVMVTGLTSPGGVGPTLRLEMLNGNVGVQPGWVWLDGRNGPFLSIDISIPLIWDACCRK